MTRPRVLVVRSGEKPFPGHDALRVEVVERVSHAIETVAPDPDAVAARADFAVVTSRTALSRGLVGSSGEALRRRLSEARIVAVGEATAEALRGAGLAPVLVADGSAEAVLAALPDRLDGTRFLLPCGEDASSALSDAIRRRGGDAVRCVVYRKVPQPPDPELARPIAEGRYRAFLPTSPAAARWLFESAGSEGGRWLREIPAVSLGPSTRALLDRYGVERIVAAPRPRFEDALALLEELATSSPGQ
jgi:uroporphyrinogen-III synthase